MRKNNLLIKGALATIVFTLLVQCKPSDNQNISTKTVNNEGNPSSLSIVFVETDSLLSKYDYSVELTEMMIKKEENIRATLNEKSTNLQKEAQDFQRKLQNQAFATRARAEQENNRLVKRQKDLQELNNRLRNELAAENQKNSLQLQDSIRTFLKEYSQKKGYDFILSNSGLDNILYGNKALNITDQVVKELNKRYSPSSMKSKK
ncbi:MAG: OmpH family outer membrane protein [Bacteroidaceae bacterium]|nr:OmpH family outer membrane protein [Bacteroidaceae bacterium]